MELRRGGLLKLLVLSTVVLSANSLWAKGFFETAKLEVSLVLASCATENKHTRRFYAYCTHRVLAEHE
jgi:hypothetical protein